MSSVQREDNQRYYTSVLGRFMTADPYMATAKGATNPTDPQSWNHYAYAGSDPVNHNDPSGQDWCDDDTLFCFSIDFIDYGTPFPDLSGLSADLSALAAQIAASIAAAEQQQQQAAANGQPLCDIQERDTPVLRTKGVHTYLDVVDRNGQTHILEGVQSSIIRSIVPRLAYLNGSDTPTGALTIDHPLSDHLDYDSAQAGLPSWLACDFVDALVSATDHFPKNKARYDLFGNFAPNSNSFIRYLLTFIPNIGIPRPAGAIGWDHSVLGQ